METELKKSIEEKETKLLETSTQLDEATQQTINRGQRLVELLKQDQYAPMEVNFQIFLLCFGGNSKALYGEKKHL